MQVADCVKCNDYQNIIGMYMTPGGHIYCEKCVKELVENGVNVRKIKAIVFDKEKA